MQPGDEEERLRAVALQNAQSILMARRHAEEVLLRQSEWLRITLTSIGDAVISTNNEGQITFLNAVAEALTGWTQAEAMGRPLTEVFHTINDQTRQPVENPAAGALRKGTHQSRSGGPANHSTLIARDGTERPIDDSAAPIRDDSGAQVGAVLIFRDVTERKRSEEALGRLATIVECSQDAIISKNLQGIIQSWNAGAERLFGYSAQEMIGQPITRIIPPDRLDEEFEILARIARGEWVEHFETVRCAKSGRQIHVSLTISPVRDAVGRIVGASKVARDITDRRRAEKALRDSDRRKDQFIALLAHELRNPLAPLRNGMQVLRQAQGDAGIIAQTRDMMERQLGHMIRLIDDLLDISRITQNKMELRRTRLLLTDIVSSAIETIRPAIEAAGHELIISLPLEPVHLNADLTRLAQVFSNLLSNSCKYTEHGGRIWFSAQRRGSDVVVVVRDTGIGIPASSLPRIFDMFSQVDRSIEHSTGGLGIGLALVKGLVEMHGGTVQAASDGQGKGSTFTVTLPALWAPAASPADVPPEVGQIAGSRRRILVVDDNRDSATTMAILLRFRGNDVWTAFDGIEAIAQAEKLRPHVVLMDVGMPRLNGYDASRRIKDQEWGRSIVIIAMTGWGQERDKLLSREAGCDAHLVKPVEISELEALLEELTDSHK